MDILRFIITPLSGAVIGYFTNWLAIKMLFRPYNEKKLFGKRLPLTPGLIPKERQRLSKKIGETLGENILTEEELAKALSSPDMIGKIEAVLSNLLKDLRDGKYSEQIHKLAGIFAEKVVSFLESPESSSFLPLGKLYDSFKGFVIKKGTEFFTSDNFSGNLKSLIQNTLIKLEGNDTPLAEYLPDGLVDGIKRLIVEKTPDAAAFVRTLSEKYPDIDEKLKTIVHKIAKDNFGSFLGIFLNYDKVYEKIKDSLSNYLDEPLNREFISEKAGNFIDKFINREISGLAKELSGKFSDETKENMAVKISAVIKSKIDDNLIGNIFASIESKAAGVKPFELLAKLVPDVGSSLEKLAENLINDLIGDLTPEKEAKLMESVVKALKTFVAKGGAFAASAFRIDAIVENKLNDFSVPEAEKLIVSVVDKELKAITWLGGVLGLIIGFVPLLFNLIGL